MENTGLFCDARTLLESTIEHVIVTAINDTLCDKDDFLAILQNNIETVLCRGNDQALADIDKRLEELQTQLLRLANSKADLRGCCRRNLLSSRTETKITN